VKQSVWVIWLGSLAAIFFGSGWVSSVGELAFWGTLVAHAVEFVVKRPVMEAAGGSMLHHFVQTLIYGLFHWKPLEERARAAQPH
jgi:ABC-type Co2+ transport system permease subunit